jgi:PKD domain
VSLDGNGAPVGTPLTIQEYGFSKDTVSALSYAVNPAGTGVVGFQRHINGGGTSVMVFSVPQGGPATNISPTGASGEPNGQLDVAINSSDAVFATWLASTSSGTVVEGALLGGSPPGAAKSLTPSQSFGSEEPGLAALIDGGGNGTAVFALYDIDSIHRVFTSRLNAGAGGGTVVGPAVISGVGNEFSQFLPGGAALESDGSILVAWSREIQDSFITKLSPTGTVGAPVELTPGALQGWSPVLGLDPAGDGVVMLESGGGTVYSLEGAPIAANGVPTGSLVMLAQTDSANRFDEASGSVAASTSGNAAVAWTVPDQELQSSEVRGSIRDGIAPAVSLSVPATAQAGAAVVMAAPGEDANPITYAWSFGDGSTGTGSVVSHAFTAAGIYTVSVTATDSAGNSTSRQASIQVLAPAPASGGGGSTPGAGGSGSAVMVRPQTKILKAPPKQTRERSVEVRFVSSQAGSSFECGLDAAGWKPCRSPLKLKGLAPGAHRLKVRATNSSGIVEAEGPVVRFQVLKPKR